MKFKNDNHRIDVIFRFIQISQRVFQNNAFVILDTSNFDDDFERFRKQRQFAHSFFILKNSILSFFTFFDDEVDELNVNTFDFALFETVRTIVNEFEKALFESRDLVDLDAQHVYSEFKFSTFLTIQCVLFSIFDKVNIRFDVIYISTIIYILYLYLSIESRRATNQNVEKFRDVEETCNLIN